jgi:hypothetical protein
MAGRRPSATPLSVERSALRQAPQWPTTILKAPLSAALSARDDRRYYYVDRASGRTYWENGEFRG